MYFVLNFILILPAIIILMAALLPIFIKEFKDIF
jgi:uncharacterized membrane protein